VKNAILLFYFLVRATSLFALDPDKAISQYVRDSWQLEDGLPQNSAMCILQTRDGYLWIGTEEGLARFDGIRFKNFDKSNTKEIEENWINSLTEDRDGALWIGTDGGGLLRYKNGKFERFKSKEIHPTVFPIYEDRKGTLWVGTLGGGVYKIQNEKIVDNYTVNDGLASNTIFSILEDRKGNLWIGTSRGLNLWKNGKFVLFAKIRGVVAICEDRAGNLWVGSSIGGLWCFRNGESATFSTKDGLINNIIGSILEDRAGNLWVATYEGGLSRWKNGTFESFSISSSDQVLALHEDREQSLWVGLAPGGLLRLADGKFATIGSTEGLPHDRVWSVHQNKQGEIWIGTSGGVAQKKRDGNWITYTTFNQLSSNLVTSVYEDSDGFLWVGTEDSGLNRCKNGKCVTFIRKSERSGAHSQFPIWALQEDRNGGMWVGTAGAGAYLLKDGEFTDYTESQGLSDNMVDAIVQDQDGSLWIGTRGAGLNHLRNGKISIYKKGNGLSNDRVLCLYIDSQGFLWIGTADGLNRFHNGKFISLKKKDGLFDDLVHNIREDNHGNFWMTCNRGVFKVSRKELDDYAGGKITSVTSVAYTKPDGLRSSECIGGFQPGVWKSADGKMWFPTIAGVAVVDPSRLRENSYKPPVYLEEILIDDVTFANSKDGTTEFSPGKKKFEFRYTALSLLIPQRVKFRYKLEGFDKDWIDVGTRRIAYYTGLPAGNYRFRVIASNNDGLWNEAGDSFSFYLNPYFYQTPWFFALSAISIVFIAFAIYRLRMKKVKEEFNAVLNERTRIAREIHDTLAQGLSGIVLQLDAAQEVETTEQSNYHLSRAQDLARNSLHEARRTISGLRPSVLQSAAFPNAISEMAKRTLDGSGIFFQMTVTGQQRKLFALVEEQLLRITQEAIVNVVKHAKAKTIAVELKYESNKVDLFVRDDGIGFDPSAAATDGHFGLTGMKERTDQMNGTLLVGSQPGKGTEIQVSISTM
jgi:ligand-binding sensor domain-containing protein/signal transduction histidine kinase